MPDFSTLSPRQREIYDFIKEKIETRGFGPTVREIGEAFNIQSPNGVMCHLKALVNKHVITREDRHARAVRIIDRRAVAGEVQELREENTKLRGENARLGDEIDSLHIEREIQEQSIEDLKDNIHCPDCNRSRREWYEC